MRRRKYAVLVAIAMFVVAGSLAGCGSSGDNTSSLNQSQVAKANVTIAAKFPTSDGAVKSLIPAGAQVIDVYAIAMPYDPTNLNGTKIATLTPTEQSKTVQITPGTYFVYAEAYNSTDVATRTMVGQTSTGGEVKSGQANTIILTFLDGQWTIVDANDTAAPLVLSDNVTQLKDFIVRSESGSQMLTKAGKSSIDFTKPIGGGGGVVRLRFNNNTSARTTGGMVSQFIGTSNSNLLGSEGYNLTKKCSFDEYYGIPCDETAGDQIVMMGNNDNISAQSGSFYESSILYGSAETLLPGSGQTTITQQNGTTLDLMAAIPDTVVTGGTVITGGIIEWKPSSNETIALGTPAVAKMAKSNAKAVKAQSTSTSYANISVKNYETIVCSGTNPQNRGTWTFANNTSVGKVVLGSRVCYTNDPNVSSYDQFTGLFVTPNAGDYSYGLVPTDTSNLGDYCHQWGYNTCTQQLPGSGDVYNPWSFRAVKSATKTAISYGSFKFNFWGETAQTGTAHIYPFRAKGSTTVTPAQ